MKSQNFKSIESKSYEKLEQNISIKNSCTLIHKSKDIFSPLKEAITNSLDAIVKKQMQGKKFTPTISISIHFKTEKDMFGYEVHTLDFISVEDNGIGFTSTNLSRFKSFGDNTSGLNNRGTGKIQIFCRFNEVSINSIFFEDNEWNNLNLIWKLTGDYNEKPEKTTTYSHTKTIVKMSDFSGDKKELDYYLRYLYSIDELKKDVLKHFLLRLWIGADSDNLTLAIKIYSGKTKQNEYTFDKLNIPEPDKSEIILINTEKAQIIKDKENGDRIKIEWVPVEPKNELVIRRFKLVCDEMDENCVYMCSKNIVVEPFTFSAVRKNANFKGFRYLSSISGPILDDPLNVNHSVDGFTFPIKKKTEEELKDDSTPTFDQELKYIFWDEIKEKVGVGLSQAYSDVEGLKEDREKNIIALAKQYGISNEDVEESNIPFNATEEEATVKLFETQAKRFAKENIEIQKTYNDLKKLETQKLNPSSEQYRSQFGVITNKLLEKIPQQNKNELARYIIRRDMVVEILKYAKNNDLAIQKEWEAKKIKGEDIRRYNEGIIHDLISKRRIKGVSNDLWILNEEFVHFQSYSDMRLEELVINGEKLLKDNIDIEKALNSVGITKDSYSKQRPDIFIFPEEGKCILIEFKSPDVDLSQHTTQIAGYARLIANYSRKERHFSQFYGFLLGENMDIVKLTAEWKKVPFGNYRVYPSLPITSLDEAEATIANLYQEIIPLSEIAKRAAIRNKSFADKLGITPDVISQVKKQKR